MQRQETYKTLEVKTSSEFKDRGSRFLGFAIPIQNVEDVKKELKVLRELHPKAVHHCYAYRIGFDQNQFRVNDDGEPSGSAGRPILGQIDRFGLTNVLIVVVRYFGGTLLGVPGLIHAYKTSAAEAILSNQILEKNIENRYNISFDYTLMNEVMRILKKQECTVHEHKMLLFCEVIVGIPVKNEAQTKLQLLEIQGVSIE
jgi:uncharacterized YigZ family protein